MHQGAHLAELDRVVDRAAAVMAEAGISKGDRLALLSHHSWQYAVLVFAAARLGVVLVPMNLMPGGRDVCPRRPWVT